MSCITALSTIRAAMVPADFDFADCGAVTALPAFLTSLNATYTRASVQNVLQGTTLTQLAANQFGTARDGVPVAYSEKNKLRFTQEFDNAFHTKNNLTVTADAANDSDGNATADKLCESSTSNVAHYLGSYTHLGIGVLQTFSIEVRAAERTQCYIQFGAVGAYFNLSTGTIISGTGVITSLGGGLYRCSVTRAPENNNLFFGLANSSSSAYAGTVGYGLYVSKAQLEFGGLTAYERNYDGVTGKYGALIEGAATNLALYSESAVVNWASLGVTNAASTFFGATNAFYFVDNTIADRNIRQAISVTAGTTYTISAYVIMDDLSAPVVGTTLSTGDFSLLGDATVITSAALVEPQGGNVYRVSASVTAAGTASRLFGIYKESTHSAKGFRVTKIQVESGNIATSYIATTGSTATRAAAKLVVPLWKNNFKYSTDLTNAYWVRTGLSSLVGGQSDPDGGTNAFKLTENSSTSNHLVSPSAAYVGAMMNMRVAAKSNGRHLFMEIGGASYGSVNLTTGAVIASTNCTITTTSLGSGWWLCDLATSPASTSPSAYLSLATSGGSTSYAGDGASGIYLYQPRLGNGSTPISFIPTTSTLDVPDNANIPGFSSAGYTLAADWRSIAARTTAVGLMELNDNTSSNRSNLLVSNSDLFNPNSVTGGASQMSIGGAACTTLRRKGAASYQANNFLAANNGVALTADTSGTMPTGMLLLNLGSLNTGASSFNGGPIFRLQLITKALTQAQLNGWTT